MSSKRVGMTQYAIRNPKVPRITTLRRRALANNPAVREAEQSAFKTFQAALIGDNFIPPEHAEEVSSMFWALGRGISSVILTQEGTRSRQSSKAR